MPSARASTERVNSSREPVRATLVRTQGTTLGPNKIASAGERRDLAEREGERQRERSMRPRRMAAGCSGVSTAKHIRQGRQQHQRQNHDQILDDQPADGDPPAGRVEQMRSSSALSSTTVLATERLRPSTTPAPRPHPKSEARPIRAALPGRSDPALPEWRYPAPPTGRRRRNATDADIRSITPISASWPADRRQQRSRG